MGRRDERGLEYSNLCFRKAVTYQLPSSDYTGDGRTAWKNISGEISTYSALDPDNGDAKGRAGWGEEGGKPRISPSSVSPCLGLQILVEI